MEESKKNDKKSPVAFSLTKKKKKSSSTTATLMQHEFADADNTTKQETSHATKPQRSSPLVIPLTEATTGPLAKLKREDAAAAQSLINSAAQHYSTSSQQQEGVTNFEADGNLTIESSSNTFQQEKSTEKQELQKDLETRADNVDVDSNAYQETPIAEFGAALLRGMGWKGNDSKKSDDASMSMPRPHRLGLGATPKLPPISTSGNKPRRPDQVQRDERLKQQHEEYEAKRLEQIKRDVQQTLQVNSIVHVVGFEGKRAKMVQLQGVPGLNRVLVKYEDDTKTTAVKKGDIKLVSRKELHERPFREVQEEEKKMKKEENGKRGDWKRIKQEDEDSGRERNRDDKRRRREDEDRNQTSHSDRDKKSSKKRRKSEPEEEEERHWLITNIRVRVVTKKVSSRQYKQKGLVLDVTHGGAYATLQMSDGQILDRVPERYLETALPKVGGKAIILTGRNQLQKGKLLERNSDTGKGVIQVHEDMNVVKLSLDDMAEWCGPLDDDMEL